MTNKTAKGLLTRGAVLVLLLAACVSCSPKIVERIVVQHDTTTVHHRDTTYRRDSIYIREWMKGDTVYVDRFRDRYVFRDRWRDSVSVREVHDTTAVEVKVEKGAEGQNRGVSVARAGRHRRGALDIPEMDILTTHGG